MSNSTIEAPKSRRGRKPGSKNAAKPDSGNASNGNATAKQLKPKLSYKLFFMSLASGIDASMVTGTDILPTIYLRDTSNVWRQADSGTTFTRLLLKAFTARQTSAKHIASFQTATDVVLPYNRISSFVTTGEMANNGNSDDTQP
jgi:hypothetical protein